MRVEARGRVGVERRVVVFGAVDRPAVGAGAVAAATAIHLVSRAAARGAMGLASLDADGTVLRDLSSRGVKAFRFEGLATFG